MDVVTTRDAAEAALPNDDRGYIAIVVISVLVPLSLFFVALRIYSRHWLRGKLGADDYTTIASMVSTEWPSIHSPQC
jgi:hypothetical protein